MTRSRTFWLAVLLLAALAFGTAAALWWPDTEPALDCAPADVRWVDAGTTLVAVCAPGTPRGPVPAGQALTVGVKLDLNRATEAELAVIPGVGPSLARRLVEERERVGGFRSWEQVDEVRGVGPSKLQALESATELGQ